MTGVCRLLSWLVGLLLWGCSAVSPARPVSDLPLDAPVPARSTHLAPYVLVLGTAQDGGRPQLGCEQACCTAARAEPERRRLVTSLLLADPATGRRWLFDASPDLPEQVQLAANHPPGWSAGIGRAPLFDGIFLTHAHIGHYAGLLPLGREAYGVTGQIVYGSAAMADYLRANGPWSLMVDEGRLQLRVVRPDEPIVLADDLTVTPLLVPHRHEFTDTLAFRIEGPTAALLYLPDIDKWERWERSLVDVLGSVDVALVDGTFHDDGEIPDRSMADIPHPFMVETLALVQGLPAATRGKLVFTHLNHTNPAADPDSPAAAAVRAAGASVAVEGLIVPL